MENKNMENKNINDKKLLEKYLIGLDDNEEPATKVVACLNSLKQKHPNFDLNEHIEPILNKVAPNELTMGNNLKRLIRALEKNGVDLNKSENIDTILKVLGKKNNNIMEELTRILKLDKAKMSNHIDKMF